MHDDGAVNTGGSILIRDYMDSGYMLNKTLPQTPIVFVRRLSDGCAVLASQTTSIVSGTFAKSGWLDNTQNYYHHRVYSSSSISPTEYYPFQSVTFPKIGIATSTTLTALNDTQFMQDAQGNVPLIVAANNGVRFRRGSQR